MKRLRLVILFLGLTLLACPVREARADAAPPEDPETTGITPYFEYQLTQVRMMSEIVTMTLGETWDHTIFSETIEQLPYVDVVGTFSMMNLGESEETMKAMFPLTPVNCHGWHGYDVLAESFWVMVNGKSVDYDKITSDNPHNSPYGCEPVTWAAFEVTFPVQQAVRIDVGYRMEDIRGLNSAYPVLGAHYILETGAAWRGTIGTADLTFTAPYTLTEENAWATPTDFSYDGNSLHWHWTDLEPTDADNIQVSVIHPDVWNEVVSLRATLRSEPENARAWYELGSAYSSLTLKKRGSGITNLRYANLAEEALANAVRYGLDVAQYHSGYADLLGARCIAQAEELHTYPPTIYLSYCYMTVQEAYRVWDLDPDYAASQSLGWASMIEGYQDPGRSYHTATATPSQTRTRVNTYTPTPADTKRPSRTWTPVSSPTRNPSLERPTATLFLTPIPTSSPRSGFGTTLGIAALLIAAGSAGALLYLALRLRK